MYPYHHYLLAAATLALRLVNVKICCDGSYHRSIPGEGVWECKVVRESNTHQNLVRLKRLYESLATYEWKHPEELPGMDDYLLGLGCTTATQRSNSITIVKAVRCNINRFSPKVSIMWICTRLDKVSQYRCYKHNCGLHEVQTQMTRDNCARSTYYAINRWDSVLKWFSDSDVLFRTPTSMYWKISNMKLSRGNNAVQIWEKSPRGQKL